MSAPQPRFLKLTDDGGNHVATRDTLTGLEYTEVKLDKAVNHQRAIDAAAAVETLGGGWQLASYHEATAIVDVTRESPAVDTEAFPWIKPRWYWLRDVTAWSSASAWGVLFDYGLVYSLRRSANGFALAVRRAGQ